MLCSRSGQTSCCELAVLAMGNVQTSPSNFSRSGYMSVCLLTTCVPDAHNGQKMVKSSCEPSCGCWELNLDPLNEQVLLLSNLSSPILV